MVSTREAGKQHHSKRQRPENSGLYKGELNNTTLTAEAKKLLSLQERQVDNTTPEGRGQRTVVSTREATTKHHSKGRGQRTVVSTREAGRHPSKRQRPENCGLYKRGR